MCRFCCIEVDVYLVWLYAADCTLISIFLFMSYLSRTPKVVGYKTILVQVQILSLHSSPNLTAATHPLNHTYTIRLGD